MTTTDKPKQTPDAPKTVGDQKRAGGSPKTVKAVKTPARRGYVVLELTNAHDGEDAWGELATDIEATTPLAAIKLAVQDKPGNYRAVPTRSWHDPIEVVAETKTVVSYR